MRRHAPGWRQVLRESTPLSGTEAADGPDPEAEVIDAESSSRLAHFTRCLLALLDPPERQAIELVVLGGLTCEEAAAQVGIGRRRMARRVDRGLRQLREAMTGREAVQ